jgi:hypothetical protein
MRLKKGVVADATQLENNPPESNPYHHDVYNMGQDQGLDLHMMFGNHASEPCRYLIFIQKSTGKRFKIEPEKIFESLGDLNHPQGEQHEVQPTQEEGKE